MTAAFFQGLFLSAALIIAIGAQNAFVIRQGVRRRHVLAVTTVCFVSDALLITAGAAGLGTLIAQSAWLREAAAWGGAAFLTAYGAKSAWSVFKPRPFDWAEEDAAPGSGRKQAVLATLAFTFLNPHVYLDTVVLIGGVAAQFAAAERMFFAAGAVVASALWFYGLGYGAARAAPFFRGALGARLLDAVICVIMFSVAGTLIEGVLRG